MLSYLSDDPDEWPASAPHVVFDCRLAEDANCERSYRKSSDHFCLPSCLTRPKIDTLPVKCMMAWRITPPIHFYICNRGQVRGCERTT